MFSRSVLHRSKDDVGYSDGQEQGEVQAHAGQLRHDAEYEGDGGRAARPQS